MDFESVMNLDYETQHLGFHPRTYLDRVYNMIYESLHEALNVLKYHLSTEYNDIVPVSSIHSSTEKLFQELVKKLDKTIDKLELFMDINIFNIPDHVLLPEDEIHFTNPITKEEDEKLDKEIEQIKQSILEERMLKNFLKSKLHEQKFVTEELVSFKNRLSEIKTVVNEVEGTQDDLKIIMEKCYILWNTFSEPQTQSEPPPQLK